MSLGSPSRYLVARLQALAVCMASSAAVSGRVNPPNGWPGDFRTPIIGVASGVGVVNTFGEKTELSCTSATAICALDAGHVLCLRWMFTRCLPFGLRLGAAFASEAGARSHAFPWRAYDVVLPATPKPARASDQPPLALASFVCQQFGDERPFCILLTTYHSLPLYCCTFTITAPSL